MPKIDKNSQTTWTTNQIENQRPTVPKTQTILTGKVQNSFNAGHNRTITWKYIMAGEKHRQARLPVRVKLLTPLTPAYADLKITFRTYFVPWSRVWTNAEKFTAQKGGASVEKVTELPNLGGKTIPLIVTFNNDQAISMMHTTAWRDHWLSSYIPRMGFNQYVDYPDGNIAEVTNTLPKINALLMRGRIAIYNDYERNKEYDEELPEYKSDTVSNSEWYDMIGMDGNNRVIQSLDTQQMRARKENSYYTDIRSEAQGEEYDLYGALNNLNNVESLVEWSNIENLISEMRSQANNAEKNDWDIISEIRGSKLLTEGKTQLIGKFSTKLNYSSITQSTYNSNSEIQTQFTVMGQQGAYSYTEINVPLYAGMKFNEEGFIHVIATVSADDTVFESAFDRTILNIEALDLYRPDLEDQKFDIMYECENGTTRKPQNQNFYKAVGFKRKFSELFKAPNVIAGDLTNMWYKDTYTGPQGEWYFDEGETVITQNTYQFNETDRFYEATNEGDSVLFNKYFWKDYSDMLLNKNQAIMNDVNHQSAQGNEFDFSIRGQNQIDIVGKIIIEGELPVSEKIKHNFTKWGEH